MRIREIIGQINSNIDTTINIVQFRNNPNSLKQVMNTIITPSFKEILTESLESIADQMIRTGNSAAFQSFLIEGWFGTGKSHLLSVFNTLFDESIPSTIRENLWERVKGIFGELYLELKGKRFLVVPLALHGSLQADLIDIVFREIEKIILERFRTKVNLSSPSKYVHFYKEECARGTKKDINDLISTEYEDIDLNKFNALDEEEDRDFYRKAEIVRECMEKLKLKLHDSYKIGDNIEEFIKLVLRESFDQLNEQVINREDIGYDGIILLIDEFSEYLKSQKKSELDEQGRSRTLASLQIQYLAEYIRDKDFFIFVAAQEALHSLDPLFEKQTGSGGRLKKLVLEHYHFVDIFNQIILPEKDDYKRRIEDIFPTLKVQYFGDSQYSIYDTQNPVITNKDIFFKCYPFHPKTFDLLIDHVLKLSTKTRAGLSYTSTYIEESLDNEIEDLITPDTLFDYFKKEIKIKETKKYTFIKDLIKKVQSEKERFSESEKEVILKVLKYIYLTQYHVYADNCIIDLLLTYDNDEELEELLNRLVVFSKDNFQYSYLRKILDPDINKQKYYLQVRGTYDIEDMVHILSQMITDIDLYEYFSKIVYDMKLTVGKIYNIKIKKKDWQYVEYFSKFEDFNYFLDDASKELNTLPKWTVKGIEFYDLHVFLNLPFREEYDNFTEGLITKRFQEYESNFPGLGDRLLFFQIKTFSELLVSEIKRCLAFDLLNRRFRSTDLKWHGDVEIQQKILIANDELLHYINNFYNENVKESRQDILNELSNRQNEYSLDSGSLTFRKIKDHYSENFTAITQTGVVAIGDRDVTEIKEDSMEDIINKYYPNFPEFLKDTDNARYINEILSELSKDQKMFEIPARKLNQVKGMVISDIGVILEIFSDVETLPSGNRIFKIGLPEDNLFYTRVMEIIPNEEEVDDGTTDLISLSKICEFLYENFGFSFKISRIFMATLLNQDKIKITNRTKSIIYDNSKVKNVFEDNLRSFDSLYVFKTKKLTRDEINWLFSFFNALFEDLEEYKNEFVEELNNIDDIDDIRSSKQQKLKELVESYNLDEFNTLSEEFEGLIKLINKEQEN